MNSLESIYREKRCQVQLGQRGVALITALLVVAIATIAVVSLASRQNMDMRRTSNVIGTDQAYLYALGGETAAKEIIRTLLRKEKYDNPEVLNKSQVFQVEDALISGSLTDLEAKFNLNSLLDGKGVPDQVKRDGLRRLIKTVLERLDERSAQPDDLVNAVIDWIDANEEATAPGGAEDSAYLSEKQPYRAANRRMASPTELLLVKGFTPVMLYGKKIEKETVPGLLKYVSALPDWATAINVNSAEPEVLLTLSSQLTESMVQDLIKERPFKETGKFTDSKTVNAVAVEKEREDLKKELAKGIQVQSRFLQANIRAQVPQAEVAMTSLLFVSEATGKIITISRSIGTDGL